MFERIVQQGDAVTTALCLSGRNDLCLTNEEMKIMKTEVSVLKPFFLATEEMSTEKRVGVSKVSLVFAAILDFQPSSEGLASQIKVGLQRRFSNIESMHVLAVATLLDPRFKKVAFSSNASIDQAQRRLISEMTIALSTSTDEEPDGQHQPETTDNGTSNYNEELWKNFDDKVLAAYDHRNLDIEAAVECRKFFEEKNVARTNDPMTWWKNNAS